MLRPRALFAGFAHLVTTATRAVSSFLPNLDQYVGLPLDLGRMETTASDTSARQQFGMVAGRADAGQLNALETLNIRGERSVTCKAGCDTHPSRGPLPASCPSLCEAFRRQPDALERATEWTQIRHETDLSSCHVAPVASLKNWNTVTEFLTAVTT